MKTITLDSIEWIESPNYFDGRSDRVKAIVGHWWGDPATNPTMAGVISHFQKEASQVSAHFVVSGNRVVQMVNMNDTAWHARQANPFTVGIEIDPTTPGNTYETVGALVKFIRGYYGDVPLKKHSDYVATACPGTIDIARIDSIARGTYVIPTPAPAPVVKPTYKVIKDGKQIGAYTVELNAYNSLVMNKAESITLDGRDVTAEMVSKYAPNPAPEPEPTPAPTEPDYSKENNDILKRLLPLTEAIFKLLKSIWGSLTSLHKKAKK